MTEEIIDVRIFYERKENETLSHCKARLQQELINKDYRLAGDTIKKSR